MTGRRGHASDPRAEPPPRGGRCRLVGRPCLPRPDRAFRALAIVLGLASALGTTGARATALDCGNAVTTPDLTACADRDYRAADQRLNEAYRQALDRIDDADLPPEGRRAYRQALQDAQRKWIPFRDAACELARFEAYGGTMAPMLVIGCLATQTEGRIQDLRRVGAPR